MTKIEAAAPQIEQLTQLLSELGQPEQAGSLKALYGASSNPAVRVVVVGAFNQGKSTLVNALIGAKVLPVSLVPTTAVLTKIVSAQPPGATLYYADGRPNREVSLEEVSEHLALDPAGSLRPALRLVEVRCPWRGNDEGPLELYDTPGFNDLPEQAEAARVAIQNADLLLFMLDARQPLTEQEEIIWQGWAARAGARPVFLLNFLNLLEEDDRELALERVRNGLRERLGLRDEPELLQINALQALRGRLRRDMVDQHDSNLLELRERLNYFAGPGLGALFKATRFGRLQQLLGEIYNSNRARLTEAEEKLRGGRERQTRQSAARQQAEQLGQTFNGVVEFKGRSLNEFEYKLLAELEQRVERWPLPELKSQVEGLTGQRLKDWLAFFERESNGMLLPITPPNSKPLRFVALPAPNFNYTYINNSPPPPPPNSGSNPDPFAAPFDFLGNAVRELGQFASDIANNLFENGPTPQTLQRERTVAHSRLAPFVKEARSHLDKQVSTVLDAARPAYVPKMPPVETVPVELEKEVSLRRKLDELVSKLATTLS